MTTNSHRRETKNFSERNHTADMAALGEIERGERASVQQNALERMAELAMAGRLAESKAMHRREFEERR